MKKKQPQTVSFEETLNELESIIHRLETGSLLLDDALTEFEKGVRLAKQGQQQLHNAEQRIQILLQENSDSELTDFVLNDE